MVGRDYQSTKQLCGSVIDTLMRAGFVINKQKSSLEPVQVAIWFGFEIDLKVGNIAIPYAKINAVHTQPSAHLPIHIRIQNESFTNMQF